MLGSTLSHFRITGKLGEGGMGEVYRAEDTDLRREVAIKVLPQGFMADRERSARFQREARILASLNHPNIASIYEIGEDDGTRFLVMEIAAGRSLAELLAQGSLELEESLEIATGIATALEVAHQSGVVHRDLKPANVMVDEDGGVKVLDFGLGKRVQPASSEGGGSDSPTLSAVMTEAHARLGTAPYMSPEQVEGKSVDFRTDVWSFGCTLYQMLAGRLPFRGESAIAVFGAILRDEPDFEALPPATPGAIRQLVERCLRRDRRRRLQSFGDARVILEDVKAGRYLEHGSSPVETADDPPVRRRRWQWTALPLAVVALAVLYGLSRDWQRGRLVSSEIRFQKITEIEGIETTPDLSPDGASIAFAGDETGDYDVYIQRSDGRRAINLTADTVEDDLQPVYSPDGTQIAFRSERLGGGIFVMGATGESVRRVTDFGYSPSWSPDGETLVVATENILRPDQRHTTSELWTVEVATGERRLLYEGDAAQPVWSPGNDRIAFWGLRPGSGQRDLWTVPAAGGAPTAVSDDPHIDWSPSWATDGSRLYFLSDRGGAMNVWRVHLDQKSGETRGKPEPLTAPTRQAGFLDVVGDSYVYSDVDRRGNIWRASFDPDEAELTSTLEPVTQGSHEYGNIHASQTGDRIAFVAWGVQQDVFVARADGTGIRRLTDDVYRDRFPRWSPDGERLLFYSDRGGRYDVWSIAADGSGLMRHTDGRGSMILYPVWSPEGDRAVATQQLLAPFLIETDQSWEEQQAEFLPSLEEGWFQPFDWSPDGRRMAGSKRLEDGRIAGVMLYEVEERRYEMLRPKISQPGSQPQPRWLPDSRRLIFLEEGAVKLLDVESRETRLLLEPPPGRRSSYAYLTLSGDGRELFVIVRSQNADLWRGTMSDG